MDRMVNNISLKQAVILSAILSTADTGRIFSVSFRKRSDGSERQILARLGVQKGVNGVGLRFSPEDKNLLIVYEMPQGRYRAIPIDGIYSATVDGMTVRA